MTAATIPMESFWTGMIREKCDLEQAVHIYKIRFNIATQYCSTIGLDPTFCVFQTLCAIEGQKTMIGPEITDTYELRKAALALQAMNLQIKKLQDTKGIPLTVLLEVCRVILDSELLDKSPPYKLSVFHGTTLTIAS
jgi:hypothetical protein